MDNNVEKKIKDSTQELPGVAVNVADDGKVSDCLEKQDTRILNNNPRNNDGPQPQS